MLDKELNDSPKATELSEIAQAIGCPVIDLPGALDHVKRAIKSALGIVDGAEDGPPAAAGMKPITESGPGCGS